MFIWIKKQSTIIITILITVGVVVYVYGCESKVQSILNNGQFVNRSELQFELSHVIKLAKIRILNLDKQDKFKAIILQNALVLVQGQPLNPFGIISAFAGIYGLSQASNKLTKTVKNGIKKRKVNNG